jgi:phosphopantetheinyl transferase (holo-ACP synthase)
MTWVSLHYPPPAPASLLTVDFAGKEAYTKAMRVIHGKVVQGAVVLEGATLEDGAKVTVLVREGEETFELKPDEEARLLEAIGDADRGDLVDAKEVLRRLERKG